MGFCNRFLLDLPSGQKLLRADLALCIVRADSILDVLVSKANWLMWLERFGGSLAKRRTGVKVGNVGDVPSIGFAVKDVDMVVLHGSLRLIALSVPPPLQRLQP